jgi:hypothetical protein
MGFGGVTITLRLLLPFLVIGSSLVTDGWAQRASAGKHTSPTVLVMRSQTTGSLSVNFSNAPSGAHLAGGTSGLGTLDLGAASYGGGAFASNVSIRKSHDRFTVSTNFGLTVQTNSSATATATVMAGLAAPERGFVLRLDGVTLGTTPQIMQGQIKLGVPTEHRLEIEVPNTLTEKDSQLHNAILFQVIAN